MEEIMIAKGIVEQKKSFSWVQAGMEKAGMEMDLCHA